MQANRRTLCYTSWVPNAHERGDDSEPLMASGWTVVLDVGKTLAKATLWNEARTCVAQRIRPNERALVGSSPTLDAVGIERWVEGILREFAHLGPVASIIPVAHGAAAALLHEGHLVCAPIDYEW